MNRRRTLFALLLVAIVGHGELKAAPITIIEHDDPARWAACSEHKLPRDRRECYYRDANTNWRIEIYEGGGIPGTPGSDIMIPNALQVLQEIVDRCKLGQTYYIRATDGVAHLHVGDPDLNSQQIGCIRTAERPGLYVLGKSARGFGY